MEEVNTRPTSYLSQVLKKNIRDETELIDSLQKSRLSLSKISRTFPLSQDEQSQDILYHRYYISELLDDDKKEDMKIYDPDFRVFSCHIWDNSMDSKGIPLLQQQQQQQSTSKVFVKSIPCYDVSTYLDFHCNSNETDGIEGKNALELKFHNKMNSCYTESIACLLVSRLTEECITPHFPRIFGIFAATAGIHPINFTEEFITYHGSDEFEKGIEQGLWSVLLEKGDNDGTDESSDWSFDDFSIEDDDADDEEEEEEDDEDEEEEEEDEGDGEEEEDEGDGEEEEDEGDGEEEEDEGDGEEEEEDQEEERKSSTTSHLLNSDSESLYSEDADNESFSSQLSFKSLKLEDLHFDSTSSNVEGNEMSIAEIVMKEIEDLQTEETLEIPRKRFSYGSSSSYFDHEDGVEKYIVLKDLPCQVVVMEGFPIVLEEVLTHDYKQLISTYVKMKKSTDNCTRRYFYIWLLKTRQRTFDRKWLAIMLQVIMALITMNHYYDMIHNDLHTQNILFEPTSKPFLHYKVGSVTYKVPTFGYIIKIIDFGRATFRFYDNELIMGDVFKAKGEAGEQFAYPNENFIKNPNAVPNRSFDLCRLGCSVLEEVFDHHRLTFITELKFYELINSWTIDDQGKRILRFTGFDLYKQIVRRVHHLEPLTQLNHEVFQIFKCSETVGHPECFHIF
jgi:hypothetical protein